MLGKLFKYAFLSLAIITIFPLVLIATLSFAVFIGWNDIGGGIGVLAVFICSVASVALTHISVDKIKSYMGW